MTPLLSTHNLDVLVGEQPVCHRLDMQVLPGQRWGLMGSNGVGKTTLLHTLAGLRAPRQGRILLRGEALSRWSARKRACQMGLLTQGDDFGFPLTVWETVAMGRYPHQSFWTGEAVDDQRRVEESLAALELLPLANRLLHTLSGGERRRTALARLLVQEAPLLLLDEPANHLDPRHQLATLQLLDRWLGERQGASIAVFHDANLAARHCDHLLLLYGGGFHQQGPLAEVLQESNLQRLFGLPVVRVSDGERALWGVA
ncbi:MAG: ABC transporter ATP-binding protein [Magnetococcales bacterium]|nr:ABC transporter ATP-binding protein [Magnetococcales bacterium]